MLIFRDVDREFPGSKFILTVRGLDAWLRSKESNFVSMREWRLGNPAVPVLFEKLYGTAAFDRERYAAAHRRHVTDVQEYFPYLNVTGKSDWATIAKGQRIRPGQQEW